MFGNLFDTEAETMLWCCNTQNTGEYFELSSSGSDLVIIQKINLEKVQFVSVGTKAVTKIRHPPSLNCG